MDNKGFEEHYVLYSNNSFGMPRFVLLTVKLVSFALPIFLCSTACSCMSWYL